MSARIPNEFTFWRDDAMKAALKTAITQSLFYGLPGAPDKLPGGDSSGGFLPSISVDEVMDNPRYGTVSRTNRG